MEGGRFRIYVQGMSAATAQSSPWMPGCPSELQWCVLFLAFS